MRFLTPGRDRRPGRGHPCPLPGAGVCGRLRRPADRGAGRAPPKPGRSAGRGGHRGRDPHRGQRQADRRPAPRRAPAAEPSGCRPSSSVNWRHILPPRSGPVATSLPPLVGGPLRVPSFRARFWVPATKAAGLQGLRIHDLRHTAVALWIAVARRPRRLRCSRHTSVSLTLDRYGHQTIPWPVAEGRCHPVRD
jgi:hypothetical protein